MRSISDITEYRRWLDSDRLSPQERAELVLLEHDLSGIQEGFYRGLSFGTAGLRGISRLGPNGMNRHVVRNITAGLATVLRQAGGKTCIVCYDCRSNSQEFAREAAAVLAGMGVQVMLFAQMRPTPQLSFAIRHFGADSGINITASHNPKEYNGYKVYWKGGMQITQELAEQISTAAAEIGLLAGPEPMDFAQCVAQGLVAYIDEGFDRVFLDAVKQNAICPEEIARAADFHLVYTPFHGTGAAIVPRLLQECGLKHLHCVEAQMVPDGAFSTVESPNPENPQSYAMALECAQQHGAHMILATDPDCDRIGFWARENDGTYTFFSANQGAILLLDYFFKHGRKGPIVTTLVSTRLAQVLCRQNGVDYYETFTGFKNMAEQVEALGTYSLAFEEAFGYMVGDHVRDKDGATAALLFCELGAYCHNRGITVSQYLQSIYEQYGYGVECAVSLTMEGSAGLRRISGFMARLRNAPPATLCGCAVRYLKDYLHGKSLDLEKKHADTLPLRGSDVLCLHMGDGTQIFVRPSGTEPKIKVYLLAVGDDKAQMEQRQAAYAQAIINELKKDGEPI